MINYRQTTFILELGIRLINIPEFYDLFGLNIKSNRTDLMKFATIPIEKKNLYSQSFIEMVIKALNIL